MNKTVTDDEALDYPGMFILTLNDVAKICATLTWVEQCTGNRSLRDLIGKLQRQADAEMINAAVRERHGD